MIYLNGARAERRGLTALGPEEEEILQPGKCLDTCMSFPVPRLQGDSGYKAGGLCRDGVALSSQSLREMPAPAKLRSLHCSALAAVTIVIVSAAARRALLEKSFCPCKHKLLTLFEFVHAVPPVPTQPLNGEGSP